LGSAFLVVVTGLAFLSGTFLVEAQATATLLQLARHAPSAEALADADPDQIAYIDQTSTMVSTLMPRWGPVMWYVTIILYLATDLAVYAVFIPSTIRGVFSNGISLPAGGTLEPEQIYGVMLAILGVVTTPMVFFSLKKTTLLQVSTTVVRHFVFWTMIGAAVAYLPQSCATISEDPGATCSGVAHPGCHRQHNASLAVTAAEPSGSWLGAEAEGSAPRLPRTVVPQADFSAVPLLFGGAVYALMCQQYIAGMLAPIASRRWASPTIGIVLAVVLVYYLVLCWTAVTAFVGTPVPPPPQSTPTISGLCQCTAQATRACPPQSLYTLNFGYLGPLGTALIVAPLLSLLSSFPVIAITLRDNMMVLYWYVTGRGAHPEDDPLVRALACCACCLVSMREPGEPDVDAASDLGRDDPSGVVTPRAHLLTPASRAEARRGAAEPMLPKTGSIQGLEESDEAELRSVYSDAQHHHGPTKGPLRTLADAVAGPARSTSAAPSSTKDAPLVLRILFGCVAVAPAFVIAALTDDVDVLVGITGGYGGALIMYVIPSLLFVYSRRVAAAIDAGAPPDAGSPGAPDLEAAGLGPESPAAARHWELFRAAKHRILSPSRSFVPSAWWALAPALFGLACVGFNTYNLFFA